MKGISGNNIILSLIYSILLLFSAINCSSLILEPVNKNTSNEEVGFIFIQGAGLESEKYVSLSKQIQESKKNNSPKFKKVMVVQFTRRSWWCKLH